MRKLTRHERQATAGVLAGLVGVLCLLAVSLGSVLHVYRSLADFRQAAHDRCVARTAFDRATNQARIVQAEEWRMLAESERTNPFIDDELRRLRVESYLRMADAVEDAVEAQVRTSCDVYLR